MASNDKRLIAEGKKIDKAIKRIHELGGSIGAIDETLHVFNTTAVPMNQGCHDDCADYERSIYSCFEPLDGQFCM